jgi:hypothetical protein
MWKNAVGEMLHGLAFDVQFNVSFMMINYAFFMQLFTLTTFFGQIIHLLETVVCFSELFNAQITC